MFYLLCDRFLVDHKSLEGDEALAHLTAEMKHILFAAGLPLENADALDVARIREILMTVIRKGLNDYAHGSL